MARGGSLWSDQSACHCWHTPAVAQIQERTLDDRKSLALRQRCDHGRRSQHRPCREWSQNHGGFAQYGHQLAASCWLFYHCCSSALQLWSSRSSSTSLIPLSWTERISPAYQLRNT